MHTHTFTLTKAGNMWPGAWVNQQQTVSLFCSLTHISSRSSYLEIVIGLIWFVRRVIMLCVSFSRLCVVSQGCTEISMMSCCAAAGSSPTTHHPLLSTSGGENVSFFAQICPSLTISFWHFGIIGFWKCQRTSISNIFLKPYWLTSARAFHF